MAKGIYLAQDCHVVNILPPVSVSGGITAQPFHMRDAGHASIILQIGASPAALTGVTLNACTNNAGANPTPIPFDLFSQTTSGTANDVLGALQAEASTGFVPADAADTFYVIEVDGDSLPEGSPYLQLDIAKGANAVIASAVAILSGLRQACESNPTATN